MHSYESAGATYINTHDNEADLLIKVLLSGEKMKGFVRRMLYYIYGGRYFFLSVVDADLHILCAYVASTEDRDGFM